METNSTYPTPEAQAVAEGTTVTPHGSIFLDNEASIEHLRFVSALSALALEAKTGMKMTRVPMTRFCRENYGTTKRTLKGCLREMLDLYKEVYGRESTYEERYNEL
jgi:hypothetical protein